MATIKSYTDIEQSKKLSEILSIGSADMCYERREFTSNIHSTVEYNCMPTFKSNAVTFKAIPAWSLSALLNVLRIFTTPTAFSIKVSTPSLIKTENGYKLTYTGDYTSMINNETPIESVADNAIDCCVNMIIHLHEINLL